MCWNLCIKEKRGKVGGDGGGLIGGGGVCMFVHVGSWCQLGAFAFHLSTTNIQPTISSCKLLKRKIWYFSFFEKDKIIQWEGKWTNPVWPAKTKKKSKSRNFRDASANLHANATGGYLYGRFHHFSGILISLVERWFPCNARWVEDLKIQCNINIGYVSYLSLAVFCCGFPSVSSQIADFPVRAEV